MDSNLMQHLLNIWIYGLNAIALMFFGYKILDWLTSKINFHDEIIKGNIAVGVLVAGIFVSLAIIIAATIAS